MDAYSLVSCHNGGYLDADEFALRDGAKVQTWQSSGSGKRNQLWVLRDAGDDLFNLINVQNGGYLDVDEAAPKDGARVQMWGSSGSGKRNQQWLLHRIGDTTYNLVSAFNGGYLDVHIPDSQNGALVQTWGSSGTGKQNQQWRLEKHTLQFDFVDAIRAFAINFPGRVKGHTLGRLEPDWGILFETDRIIKNKLWLYFAFPKSDLTQFPEGYQHAWDGILLEKSGYISADCTIPYKQTGALWSPPIPRIHRHQKPGSEVVTEVRHVKDTQISYPENKPATPTFSNYFATIYKPIVVDLSDLRSEENMGSRWIVEIGLNNGPERWAFDLGPEPEMFLPRYGAVGYHAADDWTDKRFFANIQKRSIIENRRHDGTPQP